MRKKIAIVVIVITLLLILPTVSAYAEYDSKEKNYRGWWDTVNENAAAITAVATVLYLGATIAIFLSSRSQMKQLRIHHEQSIGIQLFDRRKDILDKITHKKYKDIDLTSAKLLLDENCYIALAELINKSNTLYLDVAIGKNLIAPLFEKKNHLYYSLMKIFDKAQNGSSQEDDFASLYEIIQDAKGQDNIDVDLIKLINDSGTNVIKLGILTRTLFVTTSYAIEEQIKGSIVFRN